MQSNRQQQSDARQRSAGLRLPVTKLPFVGERADGRFGYWVMPEIRDDTDLRIQGRTFAAWFLLFREANGEAAANELMDHIEREMPSRYPAIDRAFLREVIDRQAENAA